VHLEHPAHQAISKLIFTNVFFYLAYLLSFTSLVLWTTTDKFNYEPQVFLGPFLPQPCPGDGGWARVWRV
jgi:hypothetical protein